MESRIVLGVDIGGSHITAKLVDLETGVSINESEVREPVNAKGTKEEIVNAWCDVIERAFGLQTQNRKVGIAMPGPFDYEEGVAWMKDQDKYDALYGLNIKELIAKRVALSPCDIKFLNDAESFLKGETFCGAARNYSSAVGLTLGTGLGSAYLSQGSVEDANLWCAPFKDGIAEDYLSTRWFTKRYTEATGKKVAGVKELTSHNDEAVKDIFDEFGTNLGRFLLQTIQQNKPEIIVIGGNIAHAFSLFQPKLATELMGLSYQPVLKKAMLGEEASLIGAASCWQHTDTLVESSARA